VVKDINLTLTNLFTSPVSAITDFEVKAGYPGSWEAKRQDRGGRWVNLFKKDMQAELKVNDIDGIYLYPIIRVGLTWKRRASKGQTLISTAISRR